MLDADVCSEEFLELRYAGAADVAGSEHCRNRIDVVLTKVVIGTKWTGANWSSAVNRKSLGEHKNPSSHPPTHESIEYSRLAESENRRTSSLVRQLCRGETATRH